MKSLKHDLEDLRKEKIRWNMILRSASARSQAKAKKIDKVHKKLDRMMLSMKKSHTKFMEAHAKLSEIEKLEKEIQDGIQKDMQRN